MIPSFPFHSVAPRVCAVAALALAWVSVVAMAADSAAPAPAAAQRQILVCVSAQASPVVAAAAADLVAQADSVPLLSALVRTQGAGPVVHETSQALLAAKAYDRAAFNHLIVIGLRSSDPLLVKVWEHYAAVDETAKSIYAQGWGALAGDLGYIESDRNPFLHSRKIKEAPFETILVKISGTSEAGVLAAVKAFREQGLINGIVPAGVLTRQRQTLLDLDPLVTPCPLPLPTRVAVQDAKGVAGEALLGGWTQVPANEYRAAIDAGGAEPAHVWRAKYLVPGALAQAKTPGWMAGPHRMAYGNTVNVSEFADAVTAGRVAAAIGAGAGWRKVADIAGLKAWEADQPTDENMAASLGKVSVVAKAQYVIMSSLAPGATATVLEALGQL